MTHADFQALVEQFEAREHTLLDLKAGDYATDEDRLANFHQVGQFLEISMARVALVYLLKHMQAIANAVIQPAEIQATNWSWETKTGGEGLKQRIADARNYLLLLAGCIQEAIE